MIRGYHVYKGKWDVSVGLRERNSQYSRSVCRCCTCTKRSLYTCDTFHGLFGRLLASSLITFSTSLFANAIACDKIQVAADSGPLRSGRPSFLLIKL